jgi:hypothetical protein
MPRASPGGQKFGLLTDLELITYVPDDGLHIHVHHRSAHELPTHELPFILRDDVLKALSGHTTGEIVEADAKAIARKNQDRILVAIERWLENHKGYSFRHGRPPRIRSKDLETHALTVLRLIAN